MTERITIALARIEPTAEDVLRQQGVPPDAPVKPAIRALAQQAIDLLRAEASPGGLVQEVTRARFGPIFRGEGLNDEEAPLGLIYPRADRLAVFAVTLGHPVSRRIVELFAADDLALGVMLDAAASLAAENAVAYLERTMVDPDERGRPGASDRVALGYSPGYCGWHITAQRALFRSLRPDRIGMTLNESCLMTPLKSVTGVLVCGRREIHGFVNGFGFCAACRNQACVARMERLRGAE